MLQGEHTLEDSDGGGVVVDSAGGLEGGDNDRRGGDKIVGEGVVQVALLESRRLDSECTSVVNWQCRSTWSSKTSWTASNSFSYLY